MTFHIELAGIIIRIEAIYDDVYRLCQNYLTSRRDSSFGVTITQNSIDYEKSHANSDIYITPEADPYLETLAVYREIAKQMPKYNCFLMHGSVFTIDGVGYLLTAPSGIGKTTITQLLVQSYPDSFIVNGDKPLIKISQIDNKIYACGTPWAGKEGWNRNCQVPLKAIILLERGNKNMVSKITPLPFFSTIFKQIYKPLEPESIKTTLKLMECMIKKTSFYRMIVKNYDSIKCIEASKIVDLWDDLIYAHNAN